MISGKNVAVLPVKKFPKVRYFRKMVTSRQIMPVKATLVLSDIWVVPKTFLGIKAGSL